MATKTTMPTDDGGIRSDSRADHEDWVRELREQLKRNREDELREKEKEIEDEIRVQLDEAIKSGMHSAEDRKDYLSRLRHAKEQRLRRMRAMLLEEGEERIREERTLRQWSVDGGFPTGDLELAEAFKREQQALLDKFAKDERNSTSSSHTAERQKIRSSSLPPATSFASKPPETIRPSAPRISSTNSASPAHTQSPQTYQQQQRKTSNRQIWKPPVQPSEIGHPRTSSISANANAGSSTPQRAGSKADNSARWRVGANVSYASMAAYQSPYHSAQTPAPTPTPSPCPSPHSDIQNKPKPPTPWLAELTTGYFYADPEDISETDDEDIHDSHSDADNEEYSEDVPSQAHGSLRGMPPKSSPRIIQGDRGRGRGRGQGVRATIPSQLQEHSSTDLRGKYETFQPRAVPSVNVNIHRSTERSFVIENAREEHKPAKVWKPTSDGHGEDSRPSQARPIPSSNTARHQEYSAYGEGTSFGSYGSYGSTSDLGYGLPSRRPSSANVVPLRMTLEEREKLALREVDKKWEKMDKARGWGLQTSPLPSSQPPISAASRNTIPVPQTSTARQRTPEPPSASPKPGSGSFRDKIWMPKEAPSRTKPLHARERERSDSSSASRSPPHSQPQPQTQAQRHPQPLPRPSTSRPRNDSEVSAFRNAEQYNPQTSPQPPVAFGAPPSKVPSPRPAEPLRRPSPMPSTDRYPSDMYESDFSYDGQPSAVPMSQQPTEEFLPEPSDRDRVRPRNIVDKKSDDSPSMSSESRNKGNTDDSDLKRKAEELRQREEALAQRLMEVAEREEALARREEEDRRRRENEEKLRELEKKTEEERVVEQRRKGEEMTREIEREEELVRSEQERKDREQSCMVVNDVQEIENRSMYLSKGKHKSTGQILALKRLDIIHVDFKVFYSKARIWRQLRHENVLPFIGVNDVGTSFRLLTPWMVNDSLSTFIKYFDDVDRLAIVTQIASGLQYLHSQQPAFIHGDLRTDNILVDDRRRPVIAGFHKMKQLAPVSYGSHRNAIWQAPETQLAGSLLSKASDIYAFAVTCLEVFTGEDLTRSQDRTSLPEIVMRGPRDLLCRCWSNSPQLRPTINEICNFPPIAKNAIIRALDSTEEDFSIHSSRDSASDKTSEFVLTIQRWLIDLDLISLLDFSTLERIFAIILEKYRLDDLINIINNEYSAAGRTRLIDLLHEMLQFKNEFKDRRRLDRLLTRIVKETGQIPSSIIIKEVSRNGLNPVAGGGFADVWGGMQGNMNVALKVLRIFGEGELNKKILWAFCAEVLLWHRLHHSNVMPFLGVCTREFAPRYALVSPWMKNGHLLEYLREHPLSDRRALMLGIAKGMEYLHSLKPAVIHGDLRSPNILIDDDGQPRISDFGLARLFVSEGGPLTQTSFKGQGSVFWQAPELLYPSKFSDIESGPTKNTDVYAFACVCIEIFTEKVPFSGLTDTQVIMEVAGNNRRPQRPPQPAEERGLSDAVWSLIQNCWAVQPAERPSMTAVCARIHDIIANQGSVNL